MGDGTKENPYTREDVIRLIEENGGKAKGLDLSKKVFVDRIDLSDLDLSGIILNEVILFRAVFNGSTLDGASLKNAYLGYAIFNPLKSKKAHLHVVDFEGARLHNAEFFNADLTASKFQGVPTNEISSPKLDPTQISIWNILPAQLQNVDFRNAHLLQTNFANCYFYDTKLEGAFIRGSYILEAHLEDADWGNYIIGEEIKGNFNTAENYYRRLKIWYTQAGYDGIAAKFYYREKEAHRKSLRFYYYDKKAIRNSLKIFPKNWLHRIALQFSFLVFGHGEGWKRLLFGWIFGIILLLSILYYFWGSFDTNSFWEILYYSATSFSALGYGSWAPQPTGWAKGMGAVEAIIGVFMMALLIVTFNRKWTR